MKKLILLLALLVLIGCTQPDTAAEKNKETSQASTEGEKELILYQWNDGTPAIYDTTGKLIDIPGKEKGLVTDIKTGKIAYIYSVSYVKGYNDKGEEIYTPKNKLYDTEGNFVKELECDAFDTCYGDYYVAADRRKGTGVLTNLKTGEVVLENVGKMSDGGNCLIMNNIYGWETKCITDYDFNVLCAFEEKTQSVYSPKEYFNEDIDCDYLIYTDWNGVNSFYPINSKGENLLPHKYEYLPFANNKYMVYKKDNMSYVYDTMTLEPVMECEGIVKAINDNFYIVDKTEDKTYLYNRKDNSLVISAESIEAACISEGEELFALSEEIQNKDGSSYFKTEIIDGKGNVVIKGVDYDRGSPAYMGNKGLIVFVKYNYDYEKNISENANEAYTREGKRLNLENNYNFIYQASYTVDKESPCYSYAIGGYNDKGHSYYDLLDEKGQVIISHMKAYGIGEKYIIYTQGFSQFIMNMETKEVIYEGEIFNTLDD